MIKAADLLTILRTPPVTVHSVEQALHAQGEWLGDGYNIELKDPAISEVVVSFLSTKDRKTAVPKGFDVTFRKDAKERLQTFLPFCKHWELDPEMTLERPYLYSCSSTSDHASFRFEAELTGNIKHADSVLRRVTMFPFP